MGDELTQGQLPVAREDSGRRAIDHQDLLSVIKEVQTHVLIGTSTKPEAFTEALAKEMTKYVERPLVLPLSDPTRVHEADPKDV